MICRSSTSSSNGWCSTSVPPDNSQTTSEQARPANDIGENADSTVAPCGTSLSSESASPPAIRLRWARGTGRKPSAVTSKEISAALRPSWITARVAGDSLRMALSSEAMPSGKSVPKPQTWRIENASPGAVSAIASGCRAKTRLNNPSSVGEAVGWVTASTSVASFRLRVRLLPPRFRQVARQRRGCRPFYPIPAREPLLLHVKQRDSVEARHQGPVQRPYRRNEGRPLARFQQGRDQGVDRGVLGAHVIPGARDIGGLAAPIERLLVAGRQRLVPAVLEHVEFVAEPALIELDGVDRAHADLDAGALEVALIGQRNPFLIARRHQDFEGEGRLGRALAQHRAVEVVAGPRQQGERFAERRAITARAVAYRQVIAAVENIGRDMRASLFEELALTLVSGATIGRQLRAC